MIVCGAPFFFDADQSFVEFPANFSKNPGKLSRVRGLSHAVVSWIAFAADSIRLRNPLSRKSNCTFDIFVLQFYRAQLGLELSRLLGDVVG